MKNILKHIQNTNAQQKLWKRGDTLILGVSGGADSMCLLHVFARLAPKENLTLIVAHVNYGLRGDDAARDAHHVARWAQRLGLQSEVYTVPLHKRGKSEDAWRKIRYDFFARMMHKYQAQRIVIAHHRDDQAETFLLNLLRGSGPAGLRAMPYHHTKTHVIRPLLDLSRADTVAYCRAQHVRYYHDVTNDDMTFTRNRVRHRLLPYLAKNYNPHIISTLARSAQIFATAHNDTSVYTQQTLWCQTHHGMQCCAGHFRQQSVAQQRESLRRVIYDLTGERASFGTVESFRKAMMSTKKKTHVVQAHGLICRVKGAIVTFTYEQ